MKQAFFKNLKKKFGSWASLNWNQTYHREQKYPKDRN
jgi:hypothetical protein